MVIPLRTTRVLVLCGIKCLYYSKHNFFTVNFRLFREKMVKEYCHNLHKCEFSHLALEAVLQSEVRNIKLPTTQDHGFLDIV